MSTVLLADGSALLRRLLTAGLSADGHRVVAVADGVAALTAAAVERPDLVLLSAGLPRLSAAGVTRVLRADWRTAGVPVLLLAPETGLADRAAALRAGADGWLDRDAEVAALVAAVADRLTGRPAVPAAGPTQPAPAEPVVLSRACVVLDRALLDGEIRDTVLRELAGAEGPAEVAAGILAALACLVSYDQAALLLTGPAGTAAAPAEPVGADPVQAACRAALERAGDPGAGPGLLVRRTAGRPDAAGFDLDAETAGPPPAAVLTLLLRDAERRVLGVLGLASQAVGAYDAGTLDVLHALEPVAAERLAAGRPDSAGIALPDAADLRRPA